MREMTIVSTIFCRRITCLNPCLTANDLIFVVLPVVVVVLPAAIHIFQPIYLLNGST